MRLALWHVVQEAFTLACIGPGGSGFPGALGACALAGMRDAKKSMVQKKIIHNEIAEKNRCNKQVVTNTNSLGKQNWRVAYGRSVYRRRSQDEGQAPPANGSASV